MDGLFVFINLRNIYYAQQTNLGYRIGEKLIWLKTLTNSIFHEAFSKTEY